MTTSAQQQDQRVDGTSTVIVVKAHFISGHRGARRLREGRAPTPRSVAPGRIPRVARLVALAIKIDTLIESGAITDFAEAARLGHVSRARLSQIMNLTLLAPNIVEEILHLPKTVSGRDPIVERDVRRIAATADWREQRRLWRDLRPRAGLDATGREVA